MHVRSNLSKLYDSRIQHVCNFMSRQQNNLEILDIRDIRTRADENILYITDRPQCEKYKKNIFYYGACIWNKLPVKERKIQKFEQFKCAQKRKVFPRTF